MQRPLAMLVLMAAMTLPGTAAETIRVASWNIQNLHHEDGIEQRPGIGTRRYPGDYTRLQKYANSMGRNRRPADIIALQEIGTKEGAERIFPPDDYEIIMSDRYVRDLAGGDADDIYTAVAIRKGQGISFVRQEDLDDLSIPHDGHPTRSGTAVLLDVNGSPLWVMSVHLKSSCSTTRNLHISEKPDCETLWEQRVPLIEWITARQDEGVPFIIAGDFNRRFRQFNDNGPLWRAINLDDLDEPVLDKHPETVTRRCPTRLGRSTQPIDWILVDADVAHGFVEGSFWETRFSFDDVEATGGRKGRLSDHCPISIDFRM